MIRYLKNMIHGSVRLPWITLILSAISVALFADFGGGSEVFIYDRALIEQGEFWRLVTGHFIHLDLQHLVTNVGALIALGTLYETSRFGGPGRLAFGCFALAGAMISAGLFLGDPATLYYCGLSGILNGLYVLTALALWRESGSRIWLVALGLIVLKVGYESVFPPIFSSNLAWPPHIGAHVTGIITGFLVFGWEQRQDWKRALFGPGAFAHAS
ncbi:MAG: rhombosortase [Pseudomonadota bacterium]